MKNTKLSLLMLCSLCFSGCDTEALEKENREMMSQISKLKNDNDIQKCKNIEEIVKLETNKKTEFEQIESKVNGIKVTIGEQSSCISEVVQTVRDEISLKKEAAENKISENQRLLSENNCTRQQGSEQSDVGQNSQER